MPLRLTKADVARRQLVTAITLFFNGDDRVSAFSLAANAWEIIDALCARAGVQSMSVQARSYVPADKDLKRDYINSPYRNFFKHADRDPDQSLEDFNELVLDGLLFLAVEDYLRLRQVSPIALQVFQLWYLACHPDKLSDDRIEEVIATASSIFPNIGGLERADQIALGRRVLNGALLDSDLQNDPKTEQPY
jgi:hypothetical protein